MRPLSGLGISLCIQCGSDNLRCWDGALAGYGSCDDCFNSRGHQDRNCALCLLPEYGSFIDKNGSAPFFAINRSFVVRGKLTDSVRGAPVANKRVTLAFPNGLCLHGRSDARGGFAIRVDSTEPGRPERINLGTVRHRKGAKSFFIGFALRKLSAADRALNKKRMSAAKRSQSRATAAAK